MDWQSDTDELHVEVSEARERVEERRVEPESGKSYSLAEFCTAFEGQYSLNQVQDYWRDVCVPVQESTESVAPFHGESDRSIPSVQHQ